MTTKPTHKVTIYTGGMFGVSRTEAKLIKHGTREYAQYRAAPFAVFVPKRKRTPRQYLEGSHPYLLILDGWGHPEPSDGFNAPKTSGSGLVSRQSTYTACDDRYNTEFDEKVDAYIAANDVEVVGDYRFTKKENYEPYHGPIDRS